MATPGIRHICLHVQSRGVFLCIFVRRFSLLSNCVSLTAQSALSLFAADLDRVLVAHGSDGTAYALTDAAAEGSRDEAQESGSVAAQ